MKLGIFLPLIGARDASDLPQFLVTAARTAEECGFHSLWFPEHVVLFDEFKSKYPYSADGSLPMPSGYGMLEPFTAIAFAAAVTSKIRLGTGICIVPQRIAHLHREAGRRLRRAVRRPASTSASASAGCARSSRRSASSSSGRAHAHARVPRGHEVAVGRRRLRAPGPASCTSRRCACSRSRYSSRTRRCHLRRPQRPRAAPGRGPR